jgi:hypothetical protein
MHRITRHLISHPQINIQLILIQDSLTRRIELIPSIGNQHSHSDELNRFSRDSSDTHGGYSLGSGGGAFIEPPQNLWADMLQDLGKSMGPSPRVERAFAPDGSDVLDGGDGVEGGVGDGLASGSSSASG